MAQDIFATSPDIDLRKRWALMQLQGASDSSPVKHPLQAVARAMQGAMGGYLGYQAEQADRDARENFASSLPGLGGSAPQSAPATSRPVPLPPQPQAPQPGGSLVSENPNSPYYQKAIAGIESGGDYGKLGPVIEKGRMAGDRAYGKYQVMGANVGPWTKQHFGQELTPEQFVQNPQAQDAVFNGQFGAYAKQYGPEGAARAWFAGPGNMNNMGAKDQLGTTVGSYAAKFNAGMQPYQVAALGNGLPAAPQTPPAGPQMAQAAFPGQNPPAANRSSVQIPPDVANTVRQLLRDPRTATQGMALYMQYAKPVDQWQQFTSPEGSPLQRNSVTGEVKNAGSENSAINEVQFAQKNWKSLGFPDPASTDAKDRLFWKEYNAKRLGGAGVNVAIDQSAPNEFEKEYGQGMGKRALEVVNQGDAATQDLQQNALSRSFLTKVKTGKLSGTAATVGAWAKAIGIDPAKLGIDPNLPAINEAAQSAMAQQTVGMIGSGGFPANNFSDADRKFLSSIPANIGNTPEANELLHDVRDRMAQRKIDRANAWADAREQGQSYEKFERDWRKKVAKEDLFADVRAKVEAMQGGSLGGDQGGTAEGATATNPKTGERRIFKGGQWVPLK